MRFTRAPPKTTRRSSRSKPTQSHRVLTDRLITPHCGDKSQRSTDRRTQCTARPPDGRPYAANTGTTLTCTGCWAVMPPAQRGTPESRRQRRNCTFYTAPPSSGDDKLHAYGYCTSGLLFSRRPYIIEYYLFIFYLFNPQLDTMQIRTYNSKALNCKHANCKTSRQSTNRCLHY